MTNLGWPPDLGTHHAMEAWWEYRLVMSDFPEVRISTEERPGDILGESVVVVSVRRLWKSEYTGIRHLDPTIPITATTESVFHPGEEWHAEACFPLQGELYTNGPLDFNHVRMTAEEVRERLERDAADHGRRP